MAKLEGQKIADSYEQLLHTDRDGGGNGTTLVDIKDGKNDNTFALQLATDKVQANGTLTVGVDDTGYDVKFFGDTATNGYMLWDASTDDLILGSSSKLGIGTASPTHAKMEIIGDADAFQLTMSDVADSDNTTKEARMGMLHYKSAEEPVTLFYAQSGSSTNDIYIGGGTGAGNHATSVAIATASTYNSTSTTTNMKIDNKSKIT